MGFGSRGKVAREGDPEAPKEDKARMKERAVMWES